jgi:type IV pilus assembly protein PilA
MFNKLSKIVRKNRKGFTLVELMVVVVIIGILVAIAIPVYNSTQTNAKQKACWATERIVEGSAQQFVAAGGTLTACASGAAIKTLLTSYLTATPVCPSAGVYSLTVDGTIACTVHNHY